MQFQRIFAALADLVKQPCPAFAHVKLFFQQLVDFCFQLLQLAGYSPFLCVRRMQLASAGSPDQRIQRHFVLFVFHQRLVSVQLCLDSGQRGSRFVQLFIGLFDFDAF